MRDQIKCKTTKPKILFIGEDLALSHVVRPLVLAESIKDQYDIVMAAGDRYTHLITDRHIPYKHVWTVDKDAFIQRLAKGQDAWHADDFRREVESDITIMEEFAPDLVIGDLRWSLGISANSLKVPYLSLLNAHWSPHYTLPCPPPEFPFVKILGVKCSTLLMPCIAPMVFKKLVKPFNVVRQEYCLPKVHTYQNIGVSASWVAYLDIPSLGPTEHPPASHRYIGPVQWSPPVKQPSWWNDLPQGKPVAYVSMGSTGRISFIHELVETLSDMGITIMLATSGRFEQEGFGKNVFTAEYLPGLEACKKSDLVVCNGGTGAIYQAIEAGVPILGIPTNGDQYFAMTSVHDKGAGVLLRSTHVNRKRIKDAAAKLLAEKQFNNSHNKLAEEFSQYEAVPRFQELLNELFAHFEN